MATDSLLLTTPQIVTIILGSVGLAIPVIDAIRKERGSNNHLYSAAAFGALIVSISFVIFRIISGEVVPAVQFNVSGVLSNDLFGSFFAIALLIVSIMVTASSWNYMDRRANPAAYYSLILLSSVGMVLIAYSTDLVMLLVAWELMSLPTYALAAFSKRDPISTEAAVKYFMFGALSSAILVLAIGLVYGITGTTNIGSAIHAMANLSKDLVPIGLLSIALFIAGFGFKISAVPFHLWTADVYEGSPSAVTAYLSVISKGAILFVMTTVMFNAFQPLAAEWYQVLFVLAIATMIIGNLFALRQTNLKRLLAFSLAAKSSFSFKCMATVSLFCVC